MITAEKRTEFVELYREFATDYLASSEGQAHLNRYAECRSVGQDNFAKIKASPSQDTDTILRLLLPHTDSPAHRTSGAWIHIAPAIQGDVKEWFQNVGWTKPSDWPAIAQAIFAFVSRVTVDPSQLEAACKEFFDLPYTKGFQTGQLSPILNALRPDEFMIINNKSRRVINYFSGNEFKQPLTFYPATNRAGRDLVDAVSADIGELSPVDGPPSDLFDLFCHWLVAIRRYPFGKIRYWKIAPGENGYFWDEWRDKGFVSIGWDDLGDLSGLTRGQFDKRVEEVRIEHPEWNKVRLNQVWEFAHISEGDQVLANRGTTEVLGFGTVTGPYEFVPGVEYQHRLPVEWDDVNAREVNEGGWRRTLVELKADKFAKLRDANEPVIPEARSPRYWIFQANPDLFDIDGALQALSELTWDVLKAPGNLATVGDTVFLWRSGPNGGIVGVATVSHSVAEIDAEPAEEPFTHDKEKFAGIRPRVRLHVDRHIAPELSRTRIVQDPRLGDLLILRMPMQGTYEVSRDHAEAIIQLLGEPKSTLRYTLEECASDTFIDEELLSRWIRAIERKRQAVIFGPPGTGKTFVAEHLARHLASGGDGFLELIQFHPSYSYEDFIEGIRPTSRGGHLEYPLVAGRFLEFCDKARDRRDTCVLIVDEINRADLSRVFGELMYLLEYRDRAMRLAAGKEFSIPSNVRIIGTMNTADRSIALVDYALRRRFAFIDLYPDYTILERYHETTGYDVSGLIEVLRRVNQAIGDRHYSIGVSFFLCEDLATQIEDIWRVEIEPYLEEYFFDRPDRVDGFRWDKVADEITP